MEPSPSWEANSRSATQEFANYTEQYFGHQPLGQSIELVPISVQDWAK
jgi:hypothetical protein